MIVHAVLLAWPGTAGRAGNGESECVWVPGEEELVQSALSDARWAGDNDRAGVGRRYWDLLAVLRVAGTECLESLRGAML